MDEARGWESAGTRHTGRRSRVLLVLAAVTAVLALATTVGRGALSDGDVALRVGDGARAQLAQDDARARESREGAGRANGDGLLDRASRNAVVLIAYPGDRIDVARIPPAAVVDRIAGIEPPHARGLSVLGALGSSAVAHGADGRVHRLDRDGTARVIGRAAAVLSGPRRHTWLRDPIDGVPHVVKVDREGVRATSPVPVPAGWQAVGAQTHRVLLQAPGRLRWWSPAGGRVRAQLGELALAVTDRATVVCSDDCTTIDVIDGSRAVSSATVRMTQPIGAASVSPGGRVVALVSVGDVGTSTLSIVERDAQNVVTITNDVAGGVDGARLRWLDDNVLLYPTAEGRLGAFDRRTGALHDLAIDMAGATGITTLSWWK